MKQRFILSSAVLLTILLYGWFAVREDEEIRSSETRGEAPGIVYLAESEEAGEPPVARGEGAGEEGAIIVEMRPVTGTGREAGFAYEEAVESFGRFYRDTVNETNPLVHALLVHSRGGEPMTRAETARLDALLSRMDAAPGSAPVRSYPEGYEECGKRLLLAASSLDLAADSIRGYNRTADMERLDEYRELIGWYLQAVADAKSCVADKLYPAYP